MGKIESDWGHERGHHLYEVSKWASRMIKERIGLEHMGLELKSLPLCTWDEAVYIEELIPRAKEGFALSLKAERVMKMELADILNITTPLTVEGIWDRVRLLEEENTLPEYGHFIATLCYLQQLGTVSYFSFSDTGRVDMGLGLKETYWRMNTDRPGDIWSIMERLEKLTREALYRCSPVGDEELVRIGHFFEAGKEVAKIFKI